MSVFLESGSERADLKLAQKQDRSPGRQAQKNASLSVVRGAPYFVFTVSTAFRVRIIPCLFPLPQQLVLAPSITRPRFQNISNHCVQISVRSCRTPRIPVSRSISPSHFVSAVVVASGHRLSGHVKSSFPTSII